MQDETFKPGKIILIQLLLELPSNFPLLYEKTEQTGHTMAKAPPPSLPCCPSSRLLATLSISGLLGSFQDTLPWERNTDTGPSTLSCAWY